MLISDRHRFILFLPQKCATTTLQTRFRSLHQGPVVGAGGYFEPRLGRILSKHVTQVEVESGGLLEGRDGYLKAAFARNPYDRVYSWFRWFQRVSVERYQPGGEMDRARALIEAGEDSDGCKAGFIRRTEWMREELGKADGDVNAFYRANPDAFSRVSDFTHMRGRQVVDWIGYVERFEADFDEFCRRVGLSPQDKADGNRADPQPRARCIAKPLEMTPGEHDYLEHFDRATLRCINSDFAADFSLLGYRCYRRGWFSGFRVRRVVDKNAGGDGQASG